MAWTIEYRPMARRQLKKLDRNAQLEILDYLDARIASAKTPRAFGKPLRHEQFGLWRYRVGNYRIICELQERKLVVLVVAIGHRKNIYE